MSEKKKKWEVTLLKILLIIYILLCILIAGLNYGYGPGASEEVQETILLIWHIYENPFKLALIVICSILTLRVVKQQKESKMRKQGLLAFIITASVIHLILPLIYGIFDLYFFSMPLPWTATIFKLFYPQSSLFRTFREHYGLAGVTLSLTLFIIVNIVSYAGTLILGRRWQCSMLCLFNGFASEIFSPAFLRTAKGIKKPGPVLQKVFSVIKWLFLVMAVLIFGFWMYVLASGGNTSVISVVDRIETMKYLVFELLMAMFFWVALTGRGYCYYCPVGTLCGLTGQLAGQRITTAHTRCTSCNRCNRVCPMSLDIKGAAEKGEPLASAGCVGCGHCIEACPEGNLRYSTHLLRKWNRELR